LRKGRSGILERNSRDDTAKKSQKNPSVIPAKAGIHSFQIVKKAWIPFFKGMTTFCSDICKEVSWENH